MRSVTYRPARVVAALGRGRWRTRTMRSCCPREHGARLGAEEGRDVRVPDLEAAVRREVVADARVLRHVRRGRRRRRRGRRAAPAGRRAAVLRGPNAHAVVPAAAQAPRVVQLLRRAQPQVLRGALGLRLRKRRVRGAGDARRGHGAGRGSPLREARVCVAHRDGRRAVGAAAAHPRERAVVRHADGLVGAVPVHHVGVDGHVGPTRVGVKGAVQRKRVAPSEVAVARCDAQPEAVAPRDGHAREGAGPRLIVDHVLERHGSGEHQLLVRVRHRAVDVAVERHVLRQREVRLQLGRVQVPERLGLLDVEHVVAVLVGAARLDELEGGGAGRLARVLDDLRIDRRALVVGAAHPVAVRLDGRAVGAVPDLVLAQAAASYAAVDHLDEREVHGFPKVVGDPVLAVGPLCLVVAVGVRVRVRATVIAAVVDRGLVLARRLRRHARQHVVRLLARIRARRRLPPIGRFARAHGHDGQRLGPAVKVLPHRVVVVVR